MRRTLIDLRPGVRIKALSGDQPHPSHRGWRNFLRQECEIRDNHEGVTFYGATNCNYILFPDGTLIRNFGFHGDALMARVRHEGPGPVLDDLKTQARRTKATLAG